MTEEVKYRRLGVFVFAALALLVGVLFVLGGRSLFQPTYTFETYFNDSVAGLEVGSPVRFRGVPLGQVTEILPSLTEYEWDVPVTKRRDYIVVRVTIVQSREWIERIRGQTGDMIKAGLRAQTQMAGITGQLYLSLDLLDPQEYPPLPFDWKPKYAYVPSAPSFTSQIIANAQHFLANLDKVDLKTLEGNINTLLVTLNAKASELPVADLSAKASLVLTDAHTTINHLDSILVRPEIGIVLQNVAEASGRLDALLGDPGLRQTVDNVADVSARLRRLAASGEVDRTVRHVDELASRLDGTVRDNRYDVRVIVEDLRVAADNIRTLSENLKRNPAGVLLGGPPEKVQFPGRSK
jgi:phospholipid/cholesterol/gamma-HCH transport system substrate-binding protein/paraquat-inducible protein B